MTDMSDVPDPKSTDSYRMLRAVVIGLGVLIVIAIALLVIGLATRLGGHGRANLPADAGAYVLPSDAKIRSMQVANNRLIMDVEEQGVDHVLIFNTDDGHLIGQIAPQERNGRR
ncbi:MAG TPA: DUF6476 family protein [Rhizomicrobium sp.]|nr:DUF6476 family protein [Rhizomicrobium sp.]